MAYTDGLMLIPSPLTSTPVEVEAAAADYLNIVAPCNLTVEEFGVLITENMVAQATDHVVKLQKKSAIGGSATDVISLTLGSSATLKKGDGVKSAQTLITADTDLTNGTVVLSNRKNLPVTIQAGEVLTIRAATAATGAGGAYIPFAIVRIDGGVDARQTNVFVDVA